MSETALFQPRTNLTYKYFVEIKVNSTAIGAARTISFGSERNAAIWRQFMTSPTDNPLQIQEVYPGLQEYRGSLSHVTTYDLFSFLVSIGATNYNAAPGDDATKYNEGLDILYQSIPVSLTVNIYNNVGGTSEPPVRTVTLENCWFESCNYTFDMTQDNPIILQNVSFQCKGITVSNASGS